MEKIYDNHAFYLPFKMKTHSIASSVVVLQPRGRKFFLLVSVFVCLLVENIIFVELLGRGKIFRVPISAIQFTVIKVLSPFIVLHVSDQ